MVVRDLRLVAQIFRTERSSVLDFLVEYGCLDKKSALRTAQVTVWDADAIGKHSLWEGKRYLVRVYFVML